MNTLPSWALQWGISVDALRTFLRHRPDLAGLAVKFGANRVFDEKSAEKIRAEFLALKQGTSGNS